MVEDFDAQSFATTGTGDVDVTIVSMKPEVCCGMTGQNAGEFLSQEVHLYKKASTIWEKSCL